MSRMADFIYVTGTYNKNLDMRVRNLDYMAGPINNPRFRNQFQSLPHERKIILAEYEFSPDLMSEDMYGTNEHWWILTRFNGIQNIMHPTYGFVANRVIKVPDARGVDAWLKSLLAIQSGNFSSTFTSNNRRTVRV